MDLHNLLHFLKLTLASDAQKEIQEYEKAILSLIEPYIPNVIKFWKIYILQSVSFDSNEIKHITISKSQNSFEEMSKRRIDKLEKKLKQ